MKFRSIDPKEIAKLINYMYTPRPVRWTLSLPITNEGYMVGVADYGESGYVPTNIYIPISNYYEAEKVLDEVLAIVLPDQTENEHFEIEMSSMFKRK